MRQHVVTVHARDMNRLRRWLDRPNGGLRIGRVTFESVEDGGILVRTDPYTYTEAGHGLEERN